MSNEQARAAMRNRLREREEDNDRDPLPFESYYEQLKAIADRRTALGHEQSDLLRAAKSDGHDGAILKEVVKIAAMPPEERDLKFQRLFSGLRKVGVIPDLGFAHPEEA